MVEQLDFSDRPAVAKIVMLYNEILNRLADPGGLLSCLTELKNGTPLVTLAHRLLSSEEYKAHNSGLLSADEVSRVASKIANKIETTIECDWPPLLGSLVEEGKAFVDQPAAYRWWLADYERPLLQNRPALEARLRSFRSKPTFTFVMSLTRSRPSDILKTIATIRAQIYPNVELLLTTKQLWARVFAIFLILQNRRIRLLHCREPHLAGQLLLQLTQSSHGDFTTFVKAGDHVSAIATLEFADALERNSALAIIYADSDSIDKRGSRHSPEFRSKWDPDRLLAGEDLGPLIIYSTKSIKRLLELVPQFHLDTEFELCAQIALSTDAKEIEHIPRVLCHQKSSHRNDRERTEKRQETVRQHAAKRGAQLVSAPGSQNPACFRLVYPVPQPAPLVSILIPTLDRVDLLRRCIETIFENTNYPSLEIILVDNGSCEDQTLEYYSELETDHRIHFVEYLSKFNWGAMNNAGAQIARGQVLVLLNNDTEVIEADWLNELVGQILRSEIGVVGARLLYPDHTLQHGGVVTTPQGAGRHVMRHARSKDPGYMGLLNTVREVSAVTGACLAIRKEVYNEVGGIEEHHLRVACSDVDLCLRVRSKGYRVLWTPNATLFHKENASRGSDDTPEKRDRTRKEEAYMAMTWAAYLKEDPFWSPNMAAEEDMPPLFAMPPR